MKMVHVFGIGVLLATFAVAGCSKQGQKSEESANGLYSVSTEPVTLQLYLWNGNLTEEEINRYFLDPMKKKLPHITLQVVRRAAGSQPAELISSGTFPDLIYYGNEGIQELKKFGLQYDLNELYKKFKVNTNQYDPLLMDTMNKYSDKGELLALPLSQQHSLLAYNVDIFDKFGVAYPKESMTWDEAIELAKRLTRLDGGVQYIGLDPGTVSRVGLGLGVGYLDHPDGKAVVNTPVWQKILQMMKAVYDLPGYVNGTKFQYADDFFKNPILAMAPKFLVETTVQSATVDNVNWNVTSLPNFKEELGSAREVGVHTLMISPTSPNKEQAFQVIQLATTNEVQTAAARIGRMSVLADPAINQQFGLDAKQLQGKNWEVVFKTKPRPLHSPVTDFDSMVRNSLDAMAKGLAIENKDINTLLRQAEEDANKKIEAERNN